MTIAGWLILGFLMFVMFLIITHRDYKEYSEIEKIKYIAENTSLYIQIEGSRFVSDWGRVKSIDLKNQLVKVDNEECMIKQGRGRKEHTLNRTKFPINEITKYNIVKNWSVENGSWKKYKMDKLKSYDWGILYDHIKENRSLFCTIKEFLNERFRNSIEPICQ